MIDGMHGMAGRELPPTRIPIGCGTVDFISDVRR
jgi:hypothetical protein